MLTVRGLVLTSSASYFSSLSGVWEDLVEILIKEGDLDSDRSLGIISDRYLEDIMSIIVFLWL